MSVADQPQAQEEEEEEEEGEEEEAPPAESHDQFSPKPVSEEKPAETIGEPPKERAQSYTEKISSATNAAKDAVVGSSEYGKKVASAVSEKVAGAGTAIKEKVKLGGGSTEQEGGEKVVQPDKGVSVRGLLAEKLRPGDDDRALCEVISDMIHKRKQDEEEEEKGTEREMRKTGGTRVVEKIRGAVTSLFGAGSRAPKGAEEVEGSRQEEGAEKMLEEHLE